MTDRPAPNPNQPDALVEKAARVAFDFDQRFSVEFGQAEPIAFDSLPKWAQDTWRDKARAVLAAVLPEVERHAKADALREAAVEIPGSDTNERIDPYDRAAEWLIDRADQIEKGDDR